VVEKLISDFNSKSTLKKKNSQRESLLFEAHAKKTNSSKKKDS